MDRTGFEAIDLMSAIQFDVCVRYLKEDPWQRLRLMRERVTRTKMQSAMRSKSLLSFDVQPDDVNYLWLECLAKKGIRRVRAIDALCDWDNVVFILRVPTRRFLSFDPSIGSQVPAYLHSMGRVLLARLPAEELRNYLDTVRLEPRTSQTIASKDEQIGRAHV